ncbi:MAG TPA: FtsW/RodA/SpoVE family cell cycle protein, partial [Patescibacteria group bacterium]|nr:FtsW/RodA/SpoVE family cell cycle protein [Patescibacteria group bacterium]
MKKASVHFDPLLFAVTTILVLFGLLMIYDVSSIIAYNTYGDKYHFIKDQLVWVTIGFFALFVCSRFDYHKLFNFAMPLLIVALLLLVMVFIPGVGIAVNGAHRWIDLGFTTIQPAEFVKLVLALYLAAWFSTKEKGRFQAFALLLGSVLLLVMLEPDMGTASIIMFEAIVIYFLSGGSIRYFFLGIPVVILGAFFLIMLAPYRLARLTSFLSVDHSLENASYHIKQVLIALGNGGLLGLGIG